MLIAHLASVTETMRLGSGGVMLPNHSPLVIAEQFGMLESLHPGRIDLGLGRAPGTDPMTAQALRRTAQLSDGDDFPQQLAELVAWLEGSFPDDHPYAKVKAVPHAPTRPDIWLLGSSGYSAQLAGMLGLPFSFAHHFSGGGTEQALALYRDTFRPSETLDEPYAMIGVNVVCADTDEHARWLAAPQALSMLRMRTGQAGSCAHAAGGRRVPVHAGREGVRALAHRHLRGGLAGHGARRAARAGRPLRRAGAHDHHQRGRPRRAPSLLRARRPGRRPRPDLIPSRPSWLTSLRKPHRL